MEGEYYIWSHEHKAWWKENNKGYSTNIANAGIYQTEEARAICSQANMYHGGSVKLNESLVPLQMLGEK